MEKIDIHTGIDDFSPLTAITDVGKESISGICDFDKSPVFMALEACAQLGAYHVRQMIHFDDHAFLLKINAFPLPEADCLDGRYRLLGKLTGRSDQAFSYEITMTDEHNVKTKGGFLIATKPYDEEFDKTILKPYYQKVFSCLKTESAND